MHYQCCCMHEYKSTDTMHSVLALLVVEIHDKYTLYYLSSTLLGTHPPLFLYHPSYSCLWCMYIARSWCECRSAERMHVDGSCLVREIHYVIGGWLSINSTLSTHTHKYMFFFLLWFGLSMHYQCCCMHEYKSADTMHSVLALLVVEIHNKYTLYYLSFSINCTIGDTPPCISLSPLLLMPMVC